MINEYPPDMRIFYTVQELRAYLDGAHSSKRMERHLLGNHHTIYVYQDGTREIVEWLVEGQSRLNPTVKVFLQSVNDFVDVPTDYAMEFEEQEGQDCWDRFGSRDELMEDVMLYEKLTREQLKEGD